MAELVGKSDGVCGGKGGSLHLADFNVGSLGESGIVGSSIPIATGAALSSKVLGNGKVALAFFGDGAANQGCLYESMNIAGAWDLPVVFLCENNQYALSTPAHTVTSGASPTGPRASACRACASRTARTCSPCTRPCAPPSSGPAAAKARAWSRSSPTGSTSTPRGCASAWTTATRTRRRPGWSATRSSCSARGWSSTTSPPRRQLDALDAEVRAEVDESVAFTDASPFPEPSRAFADLYTEPFGPPTPSTAPAPDRSRPMTVMSYLGAIGAAQREAMQADERVVIIGEDVEANVYGTTGGSGKSRAASGDFLEMFGANRIRNTPISERSSSARAPEPR